MSSSNPRWDGALVLGSGVVVYDGPGASAQRHRHDAIQLVVGVDASFELRTEGVVVEAGAAMVPSRADHELVAVGRTIVALVEPMGPVGDGLSRFAQGHVGVDLAGRLRGLTAPSPGDAVGALAWARAALQRLSGVSCAVNLATVRPEVKRLVRYVDDHLDDSPRLGEISAEVGLSPRQLRRTLATDVGMPFRRYVLWRRLRTAVLEVRRGGDLTTAAATAGFADSAHFSRVFRAMFGLTPSEVLPLVDIAEIELDVGG